MSSGLGAGLLDGHFLVAVPALAFLATPVAAAAGLLVGSQRLGYDRVFTESTALIIAFVFLGTAAAQLGLAAATGFVLGDALIARPDWTLEPPEQALRRFPLDSLDRLDKGLLGELVHERLPLLVGYLLLFALVLVVPAAARALSRSVDPVLNRLNLRARTLASTAVLLVTSFLLTRLWVPRLHRLSVRSTPTSLTGSSRW